MDSDNVCPNCGYQVKPEDYYCPSCKHRIEFTSNVSNKVVDLEPIAEMVQLSKALIWSSVIYIISVILSTAQFVLLTVDTSTSGTVQSVIVMSSIGMSSAAASYLAALSIGPSRKLKKIHYPSLMTLVLGIANLLLVIGLASIFPFPSTLDGIVSGLGNSTTVLQLASQYSTFFILVGTSGFLGIVGTIGLILFLYRSSRILSQAFISYGLIAGILCTLLDVFSGISVFLIIPPILIIVGARRSLSGEFPQI